jgi:apolipoprotein D and lipocalin family protein
MIRQLFAALGIGALLSACASTPPSIPPVASVDMPRFMGDWYVIAQIPTYIERKAYDSVESYRLDADGTIRTTFRYRNGSADAPVKTMEPVGRVVPGTNNAVWEMQFVWPIQAEYVIVDLAPDYSRTIVGRSKRDYVWLMSRQPSLPAPELAAAIQKIRELGYDTTKLRMVPQSTAAKAAP